MSDLGNKFLTAALGRDGARALLKAVEREPQLADVLIPRAILGWLDFTTTYEYEGSIPGVENSYVQFEKKEDGFDGMISLDSGVYQFEKSSVFHLAAAIGTALGLQPGNVDPELRDTVLVKLGKSIDTLAKAQVLMQELRKPALETVRLSTHGAYHIEKLAKSERPYAVVHTETGSPVQVRIASLKDAQPIAEWHQNRYGGIFKAELSKRVLDPAHGYRITHEVAPEIAGSGPMLRVKAHTADGQLVGHALFTHSGPHLQPASTGVEEEHQRRGLASAMYAHAQKMTGKKIIPSKLQTDEGAALWAGNAQAPQFGKTELPGRSHQPTPPQGPQAAMPPAKQPANAAGKPAAKPKLPNLAIGKSEAEAECDLCGGHQFEHNRFKGCICFRELSKSVTTTAYGDGYVLTFKPSIDPDAVKALMRTFRGK